MRWGGGGGMGREAVAVDTHSRHDYPCLVLRCITNRRLLYPPRWIVWSKHGSSAAASASAAGTFLVGGTQPEPLNGFFSNFTHLLMGMRSQHGPIFKSLALLRNKLGAS